MDDDPGSSSGALVVEVWQLDAVAKKPGRHTGGRLGPEAGREMARVQEPAEEPRGWSSR